MVKQFSQEHVTAARWFSNLPTERKQKALAFAKKHGMPSKLTGPQFVEWEVWLYRYASAKGIL